MSRGKVRAIVRKKQTVLIVEDELLIRWSLRNCLQQLGMQVVEAKCGEAGLKHADNSAFDAAIVDLRLPGIDGLEVIRQLRALQPHCRIWMMTAHGTTEAEQAAVTLGVDEFLHKPFDCAQLADRVLAAVRT